MSQTRTLHIAKFLMLLCLAILPSSFNVSLHAQSQTDTNRFAVIGDYGTTGMKQRVLAMLVDSWLPDYIITTGDNTYGNNPIDENVGGVFSNYIGNYKGGYGSGSSINRFFPSIGNHEYSDGGGIDAYLDYFTLPGDQIQSTHTSNNERYYDFVQGSIHFFVLNSNEVEPDGTDSESIQALWLKTGLEASRAKWKIVYLHHPPFSSGMTHKSTERMRWPYEEWGATAVFAGHSHTYQRVLRDDNNDGILMPYFVVGTGVERLYDFQPTPEFMGTMLRYNADLGAVLVEVVGNLMTFEYWSIEDGGTLIDSYALWDQGSCVTAYNDFGWGDGQIDKNITKITAPDDESGGLPSTGSLVSYETGTQLDIQLTVDGGAYGKDNDQGTTTLAGDAADIFEGKVDTFGTLTYESRSKILTLRLSELDPQKRYNLVFYANRDGSSSYEWERASSVALFGADSFINASSQGVDDQMKPLFTHPDDRSTRYAANNPEGRVVRFDNIDPGLDHEVALVVSWDGFFDEEIGEDERVTYEGKYANALMLQECTILD